MTVSVYETNCLLEEKCPIVIGLWNFGVLSSN